jgi:hypothetical protein
LKQTAARAHDPPGPTVVFTRLQRLLILSGLAALPAACDPNVVIGARWSLTEAGSGGVVNSAGTDSTAPTAGTGGTGSGGETAQGGASGEGDGGASAGAGGEPNQGEWCATSPWDGTSAKFDSDDGNIIPAGRYVITYVSGAQLHDPDIGYEVTRHYYYGVNGLEAGHHIFSGENPETGATSLWLDETGIVGAGGTIAQIEAANRGHTWPLRHAGGELQVVLYDDDYHDNKGPGTRFCVTPAAP